MFINYKLDYKEAFIDSNLLNIQYNSSTYYYDDYSLESENMYYYFKVYKQNNKYKFRIKPLDVFDLNIYCETRFENKYSPPNPKSKRFISYKYVVLDTGNAFILTRVKPDFEITPNHEYKGVFVPITKAIVGKFAESLGPDEQANNIFRYEFDTTHNFFFYRFTDFALFIIPFTIFIFLGIKLIIYKTNYRKHPTYKLLEKLPNEPHEMEASINSELADKENVSVDKNVYTTQNWMITKGFYKTNICRTARRGRFSD